VTSGLVRSAGRPAGTSAAEERDRLAQALAGFLERETGRRLREVAGLRRTAAGLSMETWLFNAHFDGDASGQPLVLRREPAHGGGLLDTDRRCEYRLLKALEDAAIPTPLVRWADLEGSALERPSLILRRDPGVCDYLVLNGDRDPAQRLRLAHGFCDLLAGVHTTDWRKLGLGELLDDPGPEAAVHELDAWAATRAERGAGAYPELTAVERWLREWAPAAQATVLVHGDFKPGNALIDGDEITVLLDWETAHLGDPVEDLGWVTQPTRRTEHLITGAWEQDDLLARYQAATGLAVDPVALTWWQIFASYKTAVITLTGLGGYRRGAGARLFREPAELFRILLRAMDEGVSSCDPPRHATRPSPGPGTR
jgi:aminoglycoside phosphotransferase (APT) family kinase protein